MTLKELKTQQKARAAKLKSDKVAHRQSQREQKPSPLKWGQQSLAVDSNEYRLLHIAYCMERGTPYEKIEPKVREGNEPRWDKVDAIRALIAKEVADESVVCAHSA